MTVNIDGVEPNIFPGVDDLDARGAGRNVEVFLDVRVDGKPTPVTVKLSYQQALTWPFFWSRSEELGFCYLILCSNERTYSLTMLQYSSSRPSTSSWLIALPELL